MIRRMVIVSCVCLWAEAAAAQSLQIEMTGKADAEEASADSSATAVLETPAADGKPAIPESFSAKLDYGHGLYLKGDYQGALAVYQAAKDSKSTNPLSLYFIACAQAKLEQYDEALSTLAALKTVCGEKLPSLNARGLFLAAVIAEMRGNDENSVAAWTAYKNFASGHTGIPTFVGSADARLQALRKKLELEEQYKAVRERIAAGAN